MAGLLGVRKRPKQEMIAPGDPADQSVAKRQRVPIDSMARVPLAGLVPSNDPAALGGPTVCSAAGMGVAADSGGYDLGAEAQVRSLY